MSPEPSSTDHASQPLATDSGGPIRIDDAAMRRAIAAVPRGAAEQARERDGWASSAEGPSLGGAIQAAEIPDCARPDALKRMPIRLGGLLDAPLLAYAALRGKCK